LIKPSVERARAAGVRGVELYEKSVDENTKAMVEIVKNSSIIQHLIDHGKLMVLGAKYYLTSGQVVFDLS
jgi:carbonic anhydrase